MFSERDESDEEDNHSAVASQHTGRRISAIGPKMLCFDDRSDDNLKCMQIARDGIKDSWQSICQHF